MHSLRIVALHRYPVKSLGGQSLQSAAIEPRGLTGDRRWLVTTPDGRFITRRTWPAMALCHAEPTATGLILRHHEAGVFPVAIPRELSTVSVSVWRDRVLATDAGDAVAAWLSVGIGRPVRLVYMDDHVRRPVNGDYARAGDHVSFADEFPLLITTVESLNELNRHLIDPLAMARFRPNLVIAGAAAFAEDDWQALRIGALTVRVVKPCTRCVITTQDPVSGAVITPLEPLRTLKALGRVLDIPGKPAEPVFGQNAIPDGTGTIAVGDAVTVIA